MSCEAAGRQGGSAKAAAVAGGGEKPGGATSQGGPAARRTQREQLGDANARVSEAEAVGANDAKKDGKQQRRQEVVPIVAGAGERGGMVGADFAIRHFGSVWFVFQVLS